MKIGNVTLKDSFPLMPFALAEFRKTPIDYRIFERRLRDKPANRRRITDYLVDDCRDLLELLVGFRAIVGPKDTIGSAAFHQMRGMGIEIQSLNETHDAMLRPFYFGGRVEAFEKGILRGKFSYVDINSAYPFAMLQDHAHGTEYATGARLPHRKQLDTCFARIVASSNGALPLRTDTGIHFPHVQETEFCVTGWEIRAGLETKTLKIHKVIECWMPFSFITFRDYIKHFYAKRLEAKRKGDEIGRLAFKYLLNSGYGKFAQNPRDFREYRLAPYGKNVPGYQWETDFGAISLWSRPSYQGFGFFDVATAASITGFVRAMLWRAICASKRVIYADTDAMICERPRVPLGDELGQWKDEGAVSEIRIAGKKLYGVEWSTPQNGHRHKIASKGARLSWGDLHMLCQGRTITWENEAPTFSIAGAHFIKRRISAT